MEDSCSLSINKWIVDYKSKMYTMYLENSDPDGIEKYIISLESMFDNIERSRGNRAELKKLNLPDDVIECIIDDIMLYIDIKSVLREAFTVYHFNQSPRHQRELSEQNDPLR